MFITRAYNSFELNSTTNVLTKKSKEEKLGDEIDYLVSLPKDLSIFFPRIINHGTTGDAHFVEMENYAYDSLGSIMVNQTFNEEKWIKIVDSINKIMDKFSENIKDVGELGRVYIEMMYTDKTEREYKKLINQFDIFKQLSRIDQIEINELSYKNFNVVWSKIKDYIEKTLIKKRVFSVIHGDMCFSNILCGEDPKNENVVIKFIDPRGSFGAKWIYGDSLYDAAKLRHSYEGGYEYMIYDKFTVSPSEGLQAFGLVFHNDNKYKIGKVFNKTHHDMNAKLVEGLIFIGMCARHYDSSDRQLAMYLTGVKLLNEFIVEASL